MTILKFDDVSKVFYSKTQQTTAVSHLSFEVNEGEFVAIIGPFPVAVRLQYFHSYAD